MTSGIMMAVGMLDRQENDGGGPLEALVLEKYRPAMLLDNILHNGQPQASAAHFFRADTGFEKSASGRTRQTGPGIADGYDNLSATTLIRQPAKGRLKADKATLRHGFDRIFEQI